MLSFAPLRRADKGKVPTPLKTSWQWQKTHNKQKIQTSCLRSSDRDTVNDVDYLLHSDQTRTVTGMLTLCECCYLRLKWTNRRSCQSLNCVEYVVSHFPASLSTVVSNEFFICDFSTYWNFIQMFRKSAFCWA